MVVISDVYKRQGYYMAMSIQNYLFRIFIFAYLTYVIRKKNLCVCVRKIGIHYRKYIQKNIGSNLSLYNIETKTQE